MNPFDVHTSAVRSDAVGQGNVSIAARTCRRRDACAGRRGAIGERNPVHGLVGADGEERPGRVNDVGVGLLPVDRRRSAGEGGKRG